MSVIGVLLAAPQIIAIGCLWAVLIVTIIACIRTALKEES